MITQAAIHSAHHHAPAAVTALTVVAIAVLCWGAVTALRRRGQRYGFAALIAGAVTIGVIYILLHPGSGSVS